VIEYCKQRNNNVNAAKWHDHYTANGWMVGRTKMKDWKAAVRTWENNDLNKTPPKPPDISQRPEPYIRGENGLGVPNPAFTEWERQRKAATT